MKTSPIGAKTLIRYQIIMIFIKYAKKIQQKYAVCFLECKEVADVHVAAFAENRGPCFLDLFSQDNANANSA